MGLEYVELIMRVEEEFEFEIPDADAETLDTVGALHQYVVRKLTDNPPTGFDAGRASDKVWNKLRSIVSDEFGLPLDKITPEAHFVHDLDLG